MSADSEEPISDRPEEAPAKRTAKGTNADSGSDFAEKEHSELVNIVAVPCLSVLPPKDLPIDVEAEQEQHSPPAGNQGSPTAVSNEAQRLVTHLRRAITAFCESNTVGDIPADSNRLVKSVSISIVVTSRGEHKVGTDQGLSIQELIASLEGLKTLDKPGDKAKED